jgi:hypothetical protein
MGQSHQRTPFLSNHVHVPLRPPPPPLHPPPGLFNPHPVQILLPKILRHLRAQGTPHVGMGPCEHARVLTSFGHDQSQLQRRH